MQGVPVPVFGQKDEKRPVAQKIGSGTTFTAKAKGRGLEEKRGLAHFRWTNLQWYSLPVMASSKLVKTNSTWKSYSFTSLLHAHVWISLLALTIQIDFDFK